MRITVLLLAIVFGSAAHAGIYSPFDPPPFQINNGLGQALSFEGGNAGQFPLLFTRLLNIADEKPRKNDDRAAVLARVKAFKAEGATPLQIAEHCVDLMQTGQPDRAIVLLQPLSRGRSASFVVLMNLAHAYAMTRDWNSALRTHDIALEYDMAKDLPKYPEDVRAWLLTIEKTQYRTWLRWNLNNPKPMPETQTPMPLFDKDAPKDATARLQQMLLWSPWDSNLYWLLAETYLAQQQMRTAQTIYNQLADSRQYSDRKVMMATRAYVIDAVSKLPPEVMVEPDIKTAETPKPTEEWDDNFLPKRNLLFAIGIFGPLAVLLLILQILRLRKRRP